MFDTDVALSPSAAQKPSARPARAPSPAPSMMSGVIACAEDGAWIVQAPCGAVRARRAASCLVEPRAGDRALVATVEDGGAFVLAILERGEPGATAISVEGDLSFRVPAGKVDIVSRDGVDVVSTGDVSVVSAGVAVQAGEGRIGIDTLTVLGERLVAEVPAIKAIAQTVDTVFERLSQRVKRAYRTVEELDRLRAGRVDYRAEKTMQLTGQDTLVTATDVVKIDGEHVHIG